MCSGWGRCRLRIGRRHSRGRRGLRCRRSSLRRCFLRLDSYQIPARYEVEDPSSVPAYRVPADPYVRHQRVVMPDRWQAWVFLVCGECDRGGGC
jgi:hypothetical protein